MTSVVVSDGGGNLVEYVTVVEESQQVSTTLLCQLVMYFSESMEYLVSLLWQ